MGCDRSLLALLCDAYRLEFEGDAEKERTVMKFHPALAPIKVAILPLVNKLDEPARKIYQDIAAHFKAEYDLSGTIGKRYRRQDEVGTPFCVTVDFDTLKDQAVTIRDRDSMTQERIAIDQLKRYLTDKLLLA